MITLAHSIRGHPLPATPVPTPNAHINEQEVPLGTFLFKPNTSKKGIVTKYESG